MPRRPGLDRAAVVRAAVAMLNEEGAEALSLGRLAERLGIQTPSLYNHIDGLPGLYRELALSNARAMGEQMAEAAVGRAGTDAVMAVAQAYRAYIKANPGLYLSSLRASRNLPKMDEELSLAEERVVRTVLAVVRAFDLEGDDALHVVRGLRSLVHGFATLEIAGGFGLSLDCEESFQRLINTWLRGLKINT